jgi:poly-gamma-glutamate synthesis protein (capsule biosynthesis protein)
VTAFGDWALAWGWRDGRAVAWRLEPEGDGYRLAELAEAPPSLDAVARADDRLVGWWDGGWHSLSMGDGVLLAAVGDVMLGRAIGPRLVRHGAAWPWQGIAEPLARADLRFANLECVVTDAAGAATGGLALRADPGPAVAALRAGGFDLLSVANNHSLDFGAAGLRATLDQLTKLGAAAVGLSQAGRPVPRVVTRGGLRIAFVGYTSWPASEPGLAVLDEARLAGELSTAEAGADLLVVSVHWGDEYARRPSARQVALARRMVDAGADLVLGHGAHVAQPVEVYRGRPIAYSLGNAVFDRDDRRFSSGLLLLARLRRGGVTVEQALPLAIVEGRAMPRP